jgi:hypothetical protein
MAENEERFKRLTATKSGTQGVITIYINKAGELFNNGDLENTMERLKTIASLLKKKSKE